MLAAQEFCRQINEPCKYTYICRQVDYMNSAASQCIISRTCHIIVFWTEFKLGSTRCWVKMGGELKTWSVNCLHPCSCVLQPERRQTKDPKRLALSPGPRAHPAALTRHRGGQAPLLQTVRCLCIWVRVVLTVGAGFVCHDKLQAPENQPRTDREGLV